MTTKRSGSLPRSERWNRVLEDPHTELIRCEPLVVHVGSVYQSFLAQAADAQHVELTFDVIEAQLVARGLLKHTAEDQAKARHNPGCGHSAVRHRIFKPTATRCAPLRRSCARS